jgi:hypothetical protein
VALFFFLAYWWTGTATAAAAAAAAVDGGRDSVLLDCYEQLAILAGMLMMGSSSFLSNPVANFSPLPKSTCS